MQEIDNFGVGSRLHQPSFGKYIVEQILIGNRQVFQAPVVKALHKVITGSFHECRPVRVLTGDHINKIDTSL